MIKLINKTVFNSNCDAIVNAINCVGIMGAGIALEFSLRYPKMFKQYVEDCKNNKVEVGKLLVYEEDGKKIINFPTKKHWKYPSKIEWISSGLDYLVNNYKRWGVKSIAIPPLGCKNGGLDFDNKVKPLLYDKLKNLDIEICICCDPGFAEGKEKDMISIYQKDDMVDLTSKLNIKGKAKDQLIINQKNIKRFYELNDLQGVNKEIYKKIFNYYYNKKVDETYYQPSIFDYN